MTRSAGFILEREMKRMTEVRNWGRERRPEIENRLAVTIEARIG
jgi:hypothetical protein